MQAGEIQTDVAKRITAGVNSGLSPALIPADQVSWMVNATTRNGTPECRPGWFKRTLRFKNAAGATDATLQSNFQSGRFQGKAFYDGGGLAEPCMLYSIGGRIFRVTTGTFTVSDITPSKVMTVGLRNPFVAPAIGGSVNITLHSTDNMSMDYTALVIGGKKYTLTAITSAFHITATNVNDTPAALIPRGTTVQFNALDRNANNLDRIWAAQADRFLVIQDGQSRAFIFDGSTLRRADRYEVPTGTVMAYALGRLWVASPDRRTFYGGNIIYDSTGTAAYGFADSVLKFTENQFINGGGEFAVPLNAGLITAMRVVGNLDTSLGQGPLEVFTEFSVFSVLAPFAREDWQTTTYPIQSVALISSGAESQWSTVLVNGDIWYRSAPGFQSFQVARREFGTWTNTPLSAEVDRILNYDDPVLLWASSGVNFDNRLLMTISPHRRGAHGISHRGLAVLNFDSVSGIREQDQPSWEGIWTGLEILQLVTGKVGQVERCFITQLNADDEIELWELSTDHKFDSTDNPISWVVEYRAMGFNAQGFGLVELKGAKFWLERLTGELAIVGKYRPDSYALWQSMDSGSRCADYQMGTDLDDIPPTPMLEQYRSAVTLKMPDLVEEVANNKPLRRGYQFQLRLELSGFARLGQMQLLATALTNSPKGECLGSDECQSQPGYDVYEFTYTTSE